MHNIPVSSVLRLVLMLDLNGNKMIVKYNRTSTIQQKGERFKSDKNEYDLTINDFGVSGKVEFNKRQGGIELLKLVKDGKVTKVVFEDLSRCGRTLKDSMNTLEFLISNDVVIRIRDIGIESHLQDGKRNPIWNIVTSILSSVYEMERDRILEITAAGRAQYLINGGVLGRPVNSVEDKRRFLSKPRSKAIIRLLNLGKSNRDIVARLNCSPKTVTKVRKALAQH